MYEKMKLVPFSASMLKTLKETERSVLGDVQQELDSALTMRTKSKSRKAKHVEAKIALFRRIKPSIKQTTETLSTTKALPVTSQPPAQRLLDLFKNMGIQRNRRGEMVVKGDVIPESNFEDIMHYLVRNRHTVNAPSGFNNILPYLRDVNVPKSLVLNLKARRAIYPQKGSGGRMIWKDWAKWR